MVDVYYIPLYLCMNIIVYDIVLIHVVITKDFHITCAVIMNIVNHLLYIACNCMHNIMLDLWEYLRATSRSHASVRVWPLHLY